MRQFTTLPLLIRQDTDKYLRAHEVFEDVEPPSADIDERHEHNDWGQFVAIGESGDLGTDRAEGALENHGLTDRSDDVRRTAEQALARSRGVDPEALDVDERVGSQEDRGVPGGGPQQQPRPDGKTVGQRAREEGPAPRRADDRSPGGQRGP
jgi:hypothetical protein